MQDPSDLEKLIIGGFLGVLMFCVASTTAHGLPTASSNTGMTSAPAATNADGNTCGEFGDRLCVAVPAEEAFRERKLP